MLPRTLTEPPWFCSSNEDIELPKRTTPPIESVLPTVTAVVIELEDPSRANEFNGTLEPSSDDLNIISEPTNRVDPEADKQEHYNLLYLLH
jgi:hypothetical protein